MNIYRIFSVTSVILLAIVITISSLFIWGGGHTSGGKFTQSGLDSINVTSAGVTVDHNSSLIYVNSTAAIPVFMGPMDTGSMYSFEMLGIINPVIVVQQGVDIHFTVVNIDDDAQHNFVLSSQGPPYASMGPGMMFSGGYMTRMAYLPPVSSGFYSYVNFTYTFSQTGTFWYLCTYPGHAQNGMYGKISVVRTG